MTMSDLKDPVLYAAAFPMQRSHRCVVAIGYTGIHKPTGGGDPQAFILRLLALIYTFPLTQINEAIAAQARGDCIMVVLIP